jgi:hypothetical protein
MRVRSNNGKHTVTVRGLFYGIRPLIIAELGKEPEYSNFERIVAHYENDHGLIPGLTRDPRGSLYIPHEGLTIPLGTTAVAQFRRPAWTFNKILYIEKEGFFSLLIDERWPERHDCALMTSKGYTTRAVKDLIDLLGKDGEPITVYCVHDGDAAGTMIFQTLQEATTARAARRVTVVDLGLQPWEALALGLKGEEIKLKAGEEPKTRPVADYVRAYDREHGTTWAQTLQTRRYELDEMATTGDILAWLEGKFAGTAKVMPPPEVLEQHHLETEIKRVTAQIEQEAFTAYGRDEKVAEATRQLREDATRRAANKALLAAQVERGYERDRTQSWRAIVGSLPYELGGQDAPGTARKARRTRKTTRREGDDRS